MARLGQTRTAQEQPALPVNVKGAKRNHPRMRLVAPLRPTALYEIVHGALVMPDPDHEPANGEKQRLAHYFPGEIVQLDGEDAEILLQRGTVVPLGEQHILFHTMPDREQSYSDRYKTIGINKTEMNPHPEPEGKAKLMQIDVQEAAERMYGADSASSYLGGLNGTGR